MNDNIVTQQSNTVNPDSVYFVVDAETDLTQLLDDIYPFDGNGSGDQWIIVIDCQPANYARDFGIACTQYAEALRVKREHAERCPDDFIPFDGSVPDEPLYYDDEELLFASSADLYGLNEVTL